MTEPVVVRKLPRSKLIRFAENVRWYMLSKETLGPEILKDTERVLTERAELILSRETGDEVDALLGSW